MDYVDPTQALREKEARVKRDQEIDRALRAKTQGQRVLVRFLKHKAPYNAEEVVGFPPHAAKKLVASGICMWVTPPEEPKAEEKKEEDPHAALKAKALDQQPLDRQVKKRKRGRPRKHPKPD